jgi:N-acetylglucosamine malate deacetylase 1
VKHLDRILILAPHTDDGELGCGGTIARYVKEGKRVFYVAFSICEESVPEGYPKNILKTELYSATRTLGLEEKDVFTLSYKVRKFPDTRQQILDDMIRLRNELNVDTVYLPSTQDVHQDHQVITAEGIRAFKNSNLFGYELPWNLTQFSAQAYVKLEEHHLQKKWEALKCYQTQLQLKRPYFTENFFRGLASVRGAQIGNDFAEAFEIIKLIL